ncbi:MAG: glycine cleavage system protein R [Acidimicrobiia bacterium]
MQLSVTAVGLDRPGIVAAISGALGEVGANIEDSSMTVLRGQFAMVLVIAVDAPAAEVRAAVERGCAPFGLAVHVEPVHDGPPPDGDGGRWTVSVYGADHPGIVHGVTRRLAGLGINVTDLSTRVIEGAPPVYVMLLSVVVPAGVDADAVRAELDDEAGQLGVECSLHPADAEIL